MGNVESEEANEDKQKTVSQTDLRATLPRTGKNGFEFATPTRRHQSLPRSRVGQLQRSETRPPPGPPPLKANGSMRPLAAASPHKTPTGGSNYRRYYPKEVRQKRVSNQFFRSTSLQMQFTGGSGGAAGGCGSASTSAHGSPLPKKPKTGTSSFLSLSSCPEFNMTTAPLADASVNIEFRNPFEDKPLIEEPTPRSDDDAVSTVRDTLADPVSVTFPIDSEENTDNTVTNPIEDHSAPIVSVTPAKAAKSTFGPITAAVINKGLTAKFRSLSAWLLSDHKKTVG